MAASVAACGGPPSRPAPVAVVSSPNPDAFHYDYLTPLNLNVASLAVEQRFVPDRAEPGTDMLLRAIRNMAQDRLKALGTSGRAVVLINDATITRAGNSYDGAAAVELDIYTSAEQRAAFAEARVSAHRDAGSSETPEQATLELIKQVMDQLNIELEYQVRQTLPDWLVAAPDAVPAAVDQQSLPEPTSLAPPRRP